MTTTPISPAEARAGHQLAIPAAVFEVVNELLTRRAEDSIITITQAEVLEALETEAYGFNLAEIFERHMLDFEGAYAEMGWTVTYDKPGYNESYGAYWEFRSAFPS